MKQILILAILFASVLCSDKVTIDLYHESLCPGCRMFIAQGFKEAVNTEDIDKIATITYHAYGNAQESGSGPYKFICQHGADECVGNYWETCIKAKYENQIANKVVICTEAAIDSQDGETHDWESIVTKCAQQQGQDISDVKICATGSEGNSLEHQEAVEIGNLSPAHTYVPWIVGNGQHTEKMQDDITFYPVEWICNNYKGSVQIAACSNLELKQKFGKPETCPMNRSFLV